MLAYENREPGRHRATRDAGFRARTFASGMASAASGAYSSL
jgi:hypothetical protein